MPIPVTPVQSDRDLPKKVAVAIVGGGIVGVCTALYLAEQGVEVALFEKGVIAGEQSGRNWGWVRKQGRDPREIPLSIEALKIWPTLNERIGGETGFRQRGILYISATEEQVAAREAWLKIAKTHGLDSRQLSSRELRDLIPGATRDFLGALYTESDGKAEPWLAAPAIAEGARRKGAHIFTGCAVRGVDVSAGRVSGVVTERGRVAADTVVVAGGAWSRLILKGLGIRLPQLKIKNTVCQTSPVAGGPLPTAFAGEVAWRQRLDGGYTLANDDDSVHEIVPDSALFYRAFRESARVQGGVRAGIGPQSFAELGEIFPAPLDRPGPFERTRMLDPAPVAKTVSDNLAAMKRLFPAMADAKVVHAWAGLIDVTPDIVPVISTMDTIPGLVVATGFSGHGFGFGPGAARLVTDLVTGADPVVNPHDFRLSRFLDGSPIVVTPHV